MRLLKYILLTIFLTNSLTGKPIVIATHSILADWVQNIAGNTIELVTMVPADTDNHTFEPTPADTVQLAKAQLVFENGLDMEFWLDKIYQASNSKAKRIPLSQDIQPIQISCCACHHGNCDPHFWLSIPNAIKAVNNITQSLSNLLPENKTLYQKNKKTYIASLLETHQFIQSSINSIPKNKRKLLTNHDSFRYFAREYHLKILGTALGSSSTDSMDPSAAHFAKLLKLIRKHSIAALFAENIGNNAVLQELARESKLPKPLTLYTGALSSSKGPASTYIDLMRYNTEVITSNLK